ncbi:PREDICTED: collagen alpha-1(III) chain-like [Chinchilla lanigera]|uniref:collagen alpha-1(III) chain-like n=1 Tax=Chinchilla lanigera TaxID=34839 RepID=UPI000696C4E8|nr:PREDICTED: collagen alpha-1(III) chain-like [Chinchilla lanigera]
MISRCIHFLQMEQEWRLKRSGELDVGRSSLSRTQASPHFSDLTGEKLWSQSMAGGGLVRGAARPSRPGERGTAVVALLGGARGAGREARPGAAGCGGRASAEPPEESGDRQGGAEVMGKAWAPGCEGRGRPAHFGPGPESEPAPGAVGGQLGGERGWVGRAGPGRGLGRRGAGGRGQGPCWKRRSSEVAGCVRKQGGRLLGPENGEAVWVGRPGPEGTVWCPKPRSWAWGTAGEGESGGPAGQGIGVPSRPGRRVWLGQKQELLARALVLSEGQALSGFA